MTAPRSLVVRHTSGPRAHRRPRAIAYLDPSLEADIATLAGTKQVTAKDVGTGAVNESVEGQLIRVSGAITQTFKDDSPYGYKLYINDGSGEVQVFVHVSAGFDKAKLQALTAGQRITVIGLAAQYDTTYEVAPRQPSDLTSS